MSDPDRPAQIRATLSAAAANDVVVDTGLDYRSGSPVRIRIRHRDRRSDLDDRCAAVATAGRPREWLATAERVVVAAGFNVNRRGVVFVPAVEGRDIASLALRLADTSRAVYLALLELDTG